MDHAGRSYDTDSFEGFLKYQAIDPVTLSAEDLEEWRTIFEVEVKRREKTPTVGLMKLRQTPGEEKYAVCDPSAFNGVVTVDPTLLGPRNGAVEISLVEPGIEPEFLRHAGAVRQSFTRLNGRPSVVITGRKD